VPRLPAQIEVFRKNKRSHIVNIEVSAYLRALFYENNEALGENAYSRTGSPRFTSKNITEIMFVSDIFGSATYQAI